MKSRRLGGDVVFAIVLVLTSSALVISGCSKQEPSVVSSTAELGSSPAVFANCAIVNGDFSQGLTGWTDLSEGPGLAGGVREITDVDGRSSVLHLDSRASGNYYLFYVQTIFACGIVGGTLTWDWKLAQIERSYGLAAVYVKFFNSSSDLIGQYFVRRDTGDFPQEYDCSHIISEICGDNPGIAVGCDRITGTAFDWETHTISFTNEFFNSLECNAINPDQINSIQVWIESYNNAGAGVDAYFDNFVYTESVVPIEVALDIKPGSCPNPLNPKSKGKLPIAILGTADLDVHDIDVSSLLLEGVAPIRSSIEDVSAPVENGDECKCTKDGRDGYKDLTLKFQTQDIVETLGAVAPGDVKVLTITGALLDGTPFEAIDCVVIVGGKKNR